VDVLGLHDLYKDMAYRANVILVGPKGTAKTLSVAAFAAADSAPIITYDCSEDVRRSNLIGQNYIRGGETPFILGPLTTAFEVANEAGKCILALEECNALSPQTQKILNSCTDFRRKIEVPEAGRVFRLDEGAKLWVVGTMNTAAYAGVYSLNEDLKSRFRLIDVNYPAPKDERKIVRASAVGKAAELDVQLIDSVIKLAHETRQQALEYQLSTRDVVQIVEDIAYLGVDRALRVAIGKWEGADKGTVAERITSIFGIKLR
jgi:nitric oxide reductase NorQ protein